MSRHHNYPVHIPRFAAGIRAQDVHAAGRRVWWARRWTAALEALRLGPRLGRGRSYALSGQVTDLKLQGPRVTARVLGSRPEPYTATMVFCAAEGAAYDRIVAALKAQPMLVARLLVDDLPTEVEAIFAEAGVPLFPTGGFTEKDGRKIYDVATDCSCPDYANPCKHLAAVYCLLGEEIARRPSTLLALRGVELDDLCDEDARPSAAAASEPAAAVQDATTGPGPATALLTRLGPVPFWRGTEKCVDRLEKIYTRVQPVAAAAARGESIDLREEEERVRVRGAGLRLRERGLALAP